MIRYFHEPNPEMVDCVIGKMCTQQYRSEKVIIDTSGTFSGEIITITPACVMTRQQIVK
ncbi:hypothetical protein [Nitrosomonas aestuarii]|uniref:hypothetical protein n=1 Tax=Nitrosomonas aestuarii TaxID=52441 RepID=UPI0015E62D57|nr:hypothetical protein [Nitrosomonas aestuarii]